MTLTLTFLSKQVVPSNGNRDQPLRSLMRRFESAQIVVGPCLGLGSDGDTSLIEQGDEVGAAAVLTPMAAEDKRLVRKALGAFNDAVSDSYVGNGNYSGVCLHIRQAQVAMAVQSHVRSTTGLDFILATSLKEFVDCMAAAGYTWPAEAPPTFEQSILPACFVGNSHLIQMMYGPDCRREKDFDSTMKEANVRDDYVPPVPSADPFHMPPLGKRARPVEQPDEASGSGGGSGGGGGGEGRFVPRAQLLDQQAAANDALKAGAADWSAQRKRLHELKQAKIAAERALDDARLQTEAQALALVRARAGLMQAKAHETAAEEAVLAAGAQIEEAVAHEEKIQSSYGGLMAAQERAEEELQRFDSIPISELKQLLDAAVARGKELAHAGADGAFGEAEAIHNAIKAREEAAAAAAAEEEEQAASDIVAAKEQLFEKYLTAQAAGNYVELERLIREWRDKFNNSITEEEAARLNRT